METPANSTSSDALGQFIDAARAGDQQAIGKLLGAFRGYLVFLARTQMRQRLKSKADPSDIAQEVCLAAHREIQQFRGSSPEEFAAWLRSILSNILSKQVRTYLGTQKRDARLEESIHQGVANASGFLHTPIVADISSPSERVMKSELYLQLAEAMEALPDDYRQVLILRYIENQPFGTVAERMGRSVDSVQKLWVRALAKLRTLIGER